MKNRVCPPLSCQFAPLLLASLREAVTSLASAGMQGASEARMHLGIRHLLRSTACHPTKRSRIIAWKGSQPHPPTSPARAQPKTLGGAARVHVHARSQGPTYRAAREPGRIPPFAPHFIMPKNADSSSRCARTLFDTPESINRFAQTRASARPRALLFLATPHFRAASNIPPLCARHAYL